MNGIIGKIKYKCLPVFMFLFACSTLLTAQSKFSLSAGWGYYELTNIGAQWNITEISSLSLYGGTNFGINDNSNWSAGLSFDQTFHEPIIWKLKPGYSAGVLFWTSNDNLYYFENLSVPLMAILAYPVSKSIMIKAEGGMIFTAVAQSDRKQNVETGYPQRYNGNFRLNIIFKLGAK